MPDDPVYTWTGVLASFLLAVGLFAGLFAIAVLIGGLL